MYVSFLMNIHIYVDIKMLRAQGLGFQGSGLWVERLRYSHFGTLSLRIFGLNKTPECRRSDTAEVPQDCSKRPEKPPGICYTLLEALHCKS